MIDHQLKSRIISTLVYYDLFTYPLTSEEIHQKISIKSTVEQVNHAIDELCQVGSIFKFEEFYTLKNDAEVSRRRRTSNSKAKQQLSIAFSKAAFISKFPFIVGISISGSLSKNYADDKSDLDFFIITTPGRLWIARTIFVLTRRFFIRKKYYKNYCLNYFLTSDQLAIEERNLFTATELTTLIPVFGFGSYNLLIQSNPWVFDFFPNFQFTPKANPLSRSGWFKNFIERLFRLGGDQIDRYLMNFTGRRLEKRHQNLFSKEDFALAFKTNKHVSKVHTGHNQKRILELYEQRLRAVSDHSEFFKT